MKCLLVIDVQNGFVSPKTEYVVPRILELIEQQKLTAEGAGALSVAAVMFNKIDVKGKKVVCLVSGGNIDVTILSRVISRGLLKTGRLCKFVIELMDKPGQLREEKQTLHDPEPFHRAHSH